MFAAGRLCRSTGNSFATECFRRNSICVTQFRIWFPCLVLRSLQVRSLIFRLYFNIVIIIPFPFFRIFEIQKIVLSGHLCCQRGSSVHSQDLLRILQNHIWTVFRDLLSHLRPCTSWSKSWSLMAVESKVPIQMEPFLINFIIIYNWFSRPVDHDWGWGLRSAVCLWFYIAYSPPQRVIDMILVQVLFVWLAYNGAPPLRWDMQMVGNLKGRHRASWWQRLRVAFCTSFHVRVLGLWVLGFRPRREVGQLAVTVRRMQKPIFCSWALTGRLGMGRRCGHGCGKPASWWLLRRGPSFLLDLRSTLSEDNLVIKLGIFSYSGT